MSESRFSKNLISAIKAVDQVVSDVKQARPIIRKVLKKLRGGDGKD